MTTRKTWIATPYAIWHNPATGQTASIHGALPYHGAPGAWRVEQRGFTVYNSQRNTYGCGKPPCATIEDAQALADKLSAL